MIRRDYILRSVQEMVQVLTRAVFLTSRREYEQALSEINQALRALEGNQRQPTLSPEEWIVLCQKHEPSAPGLMMATADLLCLQGDLLARQGHFSESQSSRTAALTLFLEAILTGQTFVSAELLDKVEHLVEDTSEGPRTAALWLRLIRYFEAREQFALAEDAVFGWLETRDAHAITEGFSFYERLLAKSDDDLERGGLPRHEVEQGREDLKRIHNSGR